MYRIEVPELRPHLSMYCVQDAMLAFLWSRMQTVDEIKDYARYTSHTWVDMIEALGRVADMKSLPQESDLGDAGYDNILDWAIDKERLEGNDSQRKEAAAAAAGGGDGAAPATVGEGVDGVANDAGDAGSRSGGAASPSGMGGGGGDIFRARESAGYAAPKSRLLHVKLDLLLDLIFRRLFWDPAQPEVVFSHDGLLRMVKKADKDMGP